MIVLSLVLVNVSNFFIKVCFLGNLLWFFVFRNGVGSFVGCVFENVV